MPAREFTYSACQDLHGDNPCVPVHHIDWCVERAVREGSPSSSAFIAVREGFRRAATLSGRREEDLTLGDVVEILEMLWA